MLFIYEKKFLIKCYLSFIRIDVNYIIKYNIIFKQRKVLLNDVMSYIVMYFMRINILVFFFLVLILVKYFFGFFIDILFVLIFNGRLKGIFNNFLILLFFVMILQWKENELMFLVFVGIFDGKIFWFFFEQLKLNVLLMFKVGIVNVGIFIFDFGGKIRFLFSF